MANKLNNKIAINKVKPIQTQIIDAEKKKRDKVFKDCKFFVSSNEYDTILDSDTTVHVVDAMMGKGKAQKLDSLVLSENGYIQMREVKIGTKVYGEDGELHKVIGVYPQGEKEVYRVIFSDGTFTECCKERLWTYQTPQDKLNRKYRTEELSEIIKKPLYRYIAIYFLKSIDK